MSFPRYPKYKDSGVEWLGEVPEHWDVRRLRQIGPLLKGSGGSKDDIVESGVPCIRYGDLYTTHAYFIRQARTHVSEERSADYFPIQKGDVLFAASGEDLAEIGRSAVTLIDDRVCCGGDLVILRPRMTVVPRFMGYACDCWVSKAQKASMGRGTTVKHIYPDELKRLLIALPPVPEQTAIATFLDRETAKIDALIAEQQRLIELLQEKRQAVISHAVTKGLNPDALMKDSGIEWLGEVPEHWEVWKVSRAFSLIGSGTTPRSDNPEYYEDGVIPWVNTGDLTDGQLLDCPKRVTAKALADHTSLRLYPPGSLLFAMYGATIGKLALLGFEATVNQACCVLGDGTAVEPPFMFYWFLGMRSNILSLATGGGQPNVSQDIVRSLRVACPDTAEQLRIVAFLNAKTETLELLQTECWTAITLLQERRAALISAAVTGQIDVRGFSTGGSEAA
jgi:type I restriction enzyme S subunit